MATEVMEKGSLGSHFNATHLISPIVSKQKEKRLQNNYVFLRWYQRCLVSIWEEVLSSECVPPKSCLLSQGGMSWIQLF